MKPEDIDRELESLWNRVHSGGDSVPTGSAPAPFSPASESPLSIGEVARSAALDSVRILKARHRETERRYQDQLSSKDRELESLRERLQETEARLAAARREVQDREQETTAIVLQTRMWAEEQTKIVSGLREGHAAEVARLKEEEASLRERILAEEKARGELAADFQRREQELQAQVAALESAREQAQRELEQAAAKAEAETQRAREQLRRDADAAATRMRAETEALRQELKQEREGASARLQAQMRQASERFQEELRQREAKLQEVTALLEQERKGAQQRAEEFLRAVRETVGKLLVESTAHEELEESRSALEKELKAARDEAERMKAAWAEERKQWTELWDREVATREARRGELKRWEEELRAQRESLLHEVQEDRRAAGLPVLEPPPQAPVSRPEAKPAAAVAAPPVPAPEKVRAPAQPPKETPAAPAPARKAAPAGMGWVVAALAVALAAGVGVWRALAPSGGVSLALESVSPLPVQGALSLAWDNNRLLVGTSDGRVVLFDPKDLSQPLGAAVAKSLLPYRPASMAFGDGSLWTLDSAQLRLLRQDPRNLNHVVWRLGEGALPTAIAHDGKHLWAFDASDRRLVEFHADPAAGPQDGFDVPATLSVSGMQWQGKDLWLYSARTGELLRARPENGKLNILNRQTLDPGVLAVALTDKEVVELAKDGDRVDARRLRRVYP